MGHRFSKTAANNIAAKTITTNGEKAFHSATTINNTTTSIIPIPNGNHQQLIGPFINLQIQETPVASATKTSNLDNNHITTAGILHQQQQQQHNTNSSISSSLTSVNNLSCGRQIIIKIQLAKMENGNETTQSLSSITSQQQDCASLESLTADCNLNSSELSTNVTAAGTQFLNLTLNSSSGNSNNFNSIPSPLTTAATTSLSSSIAAAPSSANASSSLFITAGSSLNRNNNYLNSNSSTSANVNNCMMMSSLSRNERPERLNTLQFNDEIVEQNIGEIVEYCEVLEDHSYQQQQQQQQPQTSSSNSNNLQILAINEETDNEANVCCRRKLRFLAANGGSSTSSSSNSSTSNNTGAKTRSRCRKCSCRDAFRRFLDPSLSRSSNNKANKQLQQQQQQQQQKEQKSLKSQDRHSINNPLATNTNKTPQLRQLQRNSMHSTNMSSSTNISPPTVSQTTAVVPPPTLNNQVSLWGASTQPQFVVVQCSIVHPSNAVPYPLTNANATNTTTAANTTNNSSLTANSLISLSHDVSPTISNSSSSNDLMVKVPSHNARANSVATGPIVHSQVDFVHYLVPDLERIINSSFYWGKMDRYEAERLLEGKPEGTFLLRDSAQEEFLFSVTFRKYGRSLHARIEQSDHRFSFDCHDPCVFTASTVTGLLEHYKDPACVMFFEPMLTIPLHRRNCFSLQKLCRATIVSNTTYDGINELELPARLKSYLKEYHYKQKLRVKSNEPPYTMHCK